jgi:hypothetical protein
MDVGGWLRNLGLGRYESAFIENAIDTDVLPELTEGDLEKLGMPLGDRKRLIKAIKAMAGGSPSALIRSEVGENAPSGYSPIAAKTVEHSGIRVGEIIAYRAWRVIDEAWSETGDERLHRPTTEGADATTLVSLVVGAPFGSGGWSFAVVLSCMPPWPGPG